MLSFLVERVQSLLDFLLGERCGEDLDRSSLPTPDVTLGNLQLACSRQMVRGACGNHYATFSF